MWNQNNGNGQGNGYGGQPAQGYGQQPQQGYGQQEDVYGRLNNTRDVGGARYPFIEGGQHKLALAVLEEFMHSTDGPSARAILKVLESRVHPVGSFVVKIWKLVKPGKFPNQPTDADQFADFCRKLKNAPPGHPIGNDIRILMKERPLEQLARGTVIDANGVPNKKGNYVNVYWNAVQQGPQEIVAMRQRIEAEGVPSANGPTPPQGQQGYQQPMQPQQMTQGGAYGQPQPNAQSGYPPAQNGYPPAQNGYPQQPQQQAPQGAPPGGFLANVPTNPQGGGNGQGGGGQW